MYIVVSPGDALGFKGLFTPQHIWWHALEHVFTYITAKHSIAFVDIHSLSATQCTYTVCLTKCTDVHRLFQCRK